MPSIIDINDTVSGVGTDKSISSVAGGGNVTQTKTITRYGIPYTLTVKKISSGTGEDVVNAIKNAKSSSQEIFNNMSDEAKSGVSNTSYSADDFVNSIINSDDPESTALGLLQSHDFYSWTLKPISSIDTQSVADTAYNKAIKEDDLRIIAAGTQKTKEAVLTLSGKDSSGTKIIHETSEFLLTGFNFSDRERTQIVQCFDTAHIQVFGRSPMVMDVAGVVIRSTGFDWYGDFMDSYERFFRASKAVEQNGTVILSVDNTIYEGHVLSINVRRDSTSPVGVAISFPMVIYKKTHLGKEPSTIDYTPISSQTGDLASSESNYSSQPGFIGPVQPQENASFIGPIQPADTLLSSIVKDDNIGSGGVKVIPKSS